MRHSLGSFIGRISDSPRDRIAAALGVLLIFGAFEFALDFLFGFLGQAGRSRTLINAAVVGAVAAIFVWLLLMGNCDRRRIVREQLKNIGELNHEVRNALDVLSLSHYHDPDKEHYEIVMQSVERIDEALHRIYPAVGGNPQTVCRQKRS